MHNRPSPPVFHVNRVSLFSYGSSASFQKEPKNPSARGRSFLLQLGQQQNQKPKEMVQFHEDDTGVLNETCSLRAETA